jgi:beta-glucosidase
MLDGPRGLSAASGLQATEFPVAMMRGATWDPDLEDQVGQAIARELLSGGADVLLAPTMNILRPPRWGRAPETYSEDVHHMGAMSVAFIRGVQTQGVLASARHYAANSIEDTRFDVDVQIDERTLREIYLPHFGRAVTEAKVASVMSAYNSIKRPHRRSASSPAVGRPQGGMELRRLRGV